MGRAMMNNFVLALAIGLLGSLAIATETLAADKKAQDIVAGMVRTRDALLGQQPALHLIDTAVRKDCSTKHNSEAPGGAFCSCASAVTFGLWASGIDPNMEGRLTAFLAKPDGAAAEEFAASYQGPELYVPLCRKAV